MLRIMSSLQSLPLTSWGVLYCHLLVNLAKRMTISSSCWRLVKPCGVLWWIRHWHVRLAAVVVVLLRMKLWQRSCLVTPCFRWLCGLRRGYRVGSVIHRQKLIRVCLRLYSSRNFLNPSRRRWVGAVFPLRWYTAYLNIWLTTLTMNSTPSGIGNPWFVTLKGGEWNNNFCFPIWCLFV